MKYARPLSRGRCNGAGLEGTGGICNSRISSARQGLRRQAPCEGESVIPRPNLFVVVTESCWRLSGGIWACSWPTLVPHPTPTSSSSGTVSDSTILSDTCSVVGKSKTEKLFHPGIFHYHTSCVSTGVDTSLLTGIFAFLSINIISLLNTHTYAQSISFTFSAPLPSYNLFFSLSRSLFQCARATPE